ncbi:MAG: GDP-L-fucose synthase [Candidatus Competibacteraceae bacterium]|nr:GDP-L-fucose synthase [Candidatus Competibacteraceae bacterium]
MKKTARIYVAGHCGLVGSALARQLMAQGYSKILTRTHADLDLTQPDAVDAFFALERPQYVFLAAAKVGGIQVNAAYPADFISDNLAIQQNVMTAAHCHGVERLLFFGSNCAYPRDFPRPIREDELLAGPLEDTNRAYAIAKLAGIEMCRAYRRQHGARYLTVMPASLYGPGDCYDLQKSHVLPALIRKCHEAKARRETEIVIWGSGTPRREFLYSDDLAAACVFLMNLADADFDALLDAPGAPGLINIGCGEDLSIADLARIVARVIGFSGVLTFDTRKPDGTPHKQLDSRRIQALGWRPTTSFEVGIAQVYQDFLDNELS